VDDGREDRYPYHHHCSLVPDFGFGFGFYFYFDAGADADAVAWPVISINC